MRRDKDDWKMCPMMQMQMMNSKGMMCPMGDQHQEMMHGMHHDHDKEGMHHGMMMCPMMYGQGMNMGMMGCPMMQNMMMQPACPMMQMQMMNPKGTMCPMMEPNEMDDMKMRTVDASDIED